jgi:hypothetical protein
MSNRTRNIRTREYITIYKYVVTRKALEIVHLELLNLLEETGLERDYGYLH